MTRLKKGDQVVVVAGADRGRTGRLLDIDRKKGMALVEGVNMKFKHMRRSQEMPQGGRIEREFATQVQLSHDTHGREKVQGNHQTQVGSPKG